MLFSSFNVTIYNFTSNQYRKQKIAIVENISDEIAMQNVKAGKIAEMSVLFERYHLKLYNFFVKMGLPKDISQDMTQNLFYRMIKYRHSFKEGNSVKSWIYQIARNLHADYCKQIRKAGDLIMNAESCPDIIMPETDGFPEEDYEKLDRAIMSLSDAQRELIVLSRYQGLKYEEISSITNQSVSAIKVGIHRALRQLRTVFVTQN